MASASVDLVSIAASLRRARDETATFGAALRELPVTSLPPRGRARKTFDSFDVDGSGAIGSDEVVLGLRAYGVDVGSEVEQRIFQEVDANGDGKIDYLEFGALIERVSALQQGKVWPAEADRLTAAARTLHAQAVTDPLALVAEGEIPTLLRCASSGHAAVEQLGLSALAAVAAAPHVQCAQALVSRSALADVISALGRETTPLTSVRLGARLLAARRAVAAAGLNGAGGAQPGRSKRLGARLRARAR